MKSLALNLNLKSSVSLSLLLHGSLFALALMMTSHKIIPEPIGVELMYGEQDSAPVLSAAPAAPQVAPRVAAPQSDEGIATDDKKNEKPQPVAAAESAKTLGNPMGNSDKGALTGREGVANGQEVSAEERYMYELRKLLERRKRYPTMALKMGQKGRVMLRLTLAQDGSLVGSEILEKAPFESLNQAATDLAKSISGLRPFPEEIKRTTWAITVPISYDLN